jgi:hypothetical protein
MRVMIFRGMNQNASPAKNLAAYAKHRSEDYKS